MPRIISPQGSELGLLRTALEPGELRVLEFFDSVLPEGWEIYIQPKLNGLRPDFILLNPNVGIGIFEVRDWDLQANQFWMHRDSDGFPLLWSQGKDTVDVVVEYNPVETVYAYKQKLPQFFLPLLGFDKITDFDKLGVVTTGIIFTSAETETVRRLLNPFKAHYGLKPYWCHPVSGSDALERLALKQVFPEAYRPQWRLMAHWCVGVLRSWLVESGHTNAQRQPLELDMRQKQLATSRPTNGHRRIKGPVGAGKSQVLAARTAQLASECKEVLVVTFNISQWHYLRYLTIRYAELEIQNTQNITWAHFYSWADDICRAGGMRKEFWKLLAGISFSDGERSDKSERLSTSNRQQINEQKIPQLVSQAMARLAQTGKLPTYDAVLVDEGQEFNLKWWNLLRKVCKPGGEMLLVADQTTGLNSKMTPWIEGTMRGAGFTRGWIRMQDNYRIPSAIIPYVESYTSQHLPQSVENVPKTARSMIDEGFPAVLRWIQIGPATSGEQVVVDQMASILACGREVSEADLTLIMPNDELVNRCLNFFKSRRICVSRASAASMEKDQLRKMANLWVGVRIAAVPNTTWFESRAIIVWVDLTSGKAGNTAIQFAMTHLKWHPDCSFITVICQDDSLKAYGQTWPEFIEY